MYLKKVRINEMDFARQNDKNLSKFRMLAAGWGARLPFGG